MKPGASDDLHTPVAGVYTITPDVAPEAVERYRGGGAVPEIKRVPLLREAHHAAGNNRSNRLKFDLLFAPIVVPDVREALLAGLD